MTGRLMKGGHIFLMKRINLFNSYDDDNYYEVKAMMTGRLMKGDYIFCLMKRIYSILMMMIMIMK